MHSTAAIVGLVLGVAGVLLAIAVRARWGRPLGAALLVVAVAAEVFGLQAHAQPGGSLVSPPATFPTGGGFTTSPTGSSTPTTHPPSTLPTFLPHLLSQVHPGLEPIIKQVTVNKEFVRLTNNGTHDFHLGGWHLSNGTVTFTFPVLVLPAHKSLVVRTGLGSNTATILHWNLSSYVWPHPTGKITLTDGHGKVIDTCNYTLGSGEQSATC